MKSWISTLVMLGLLIGSCEKRPDEPVTTVEPSGAFVTAALHGDLSKIVDDLEPEFANRFRERFINGLNDVPDEDDAAIKILITNYRAYWRAALLDPERREQHEVQLGEELARLIPALNTDNPITAVKPFIEAHGYHGIAGRTPPLLELIVWRRNRSENTEIELTDGVMEVPVIYLEEFVSRGWSSFATFGRASSGGWTDKTGIYCVAESYDLDSEKFQVSLLQHEARHFADYQLYPELEGADLEYRAKLTELAFAGQTLQSLLVGFSARGARIDNAPHALANWYVIHDMLEELALGPTAGINSASSDALVALPAADIRHTARLLLSKHDRDLEAAGAQSVKGILLP